MRFKMAHGWGMTLMAIWLIVTGLVVLFSIGAAQIGTVLAILAVAAGVLILLGR